MTDQTTRLTGVRPGDVRPLLTLGGTTPFRRRTWCGLNQAMMVFLGMAVAPGAEENEAHDRCHKRTDHTDDHSRGWTPQHENPDRLGT